MFTQKSLSLLLLIALVLCCSSAFAKQKTKNGGYNPFKAKNANLTDHAVQKVTDYDEWFVPTQLFRLEELYPVNQIVQFRYLMESFSVPRTLSQVQFKLNYFDSFLSQRQVNNALLDPPYNCEVFVALMHVPNNSPAPNINSLSGMPFTDDRMNVISGDSFLLYQKEDATDPSLMIAQKTGFTWDLDIVLERPMDIYAGDEMMLILRRECHENPGSIPGWRLSGHYALL